MKTISLKGWFTKEWFKTLARILLRIFLFELFVVPFCVCLFIFAAFAFFPEVPFFIKSAIKSPYLIQRVFNVVLL